MIALDCSNCETKFRRSPTYHREIQRDGDPVVCFDCMAAHVTGRQDVTRLVTGLREVAYAAKVANGWLIVMDDRTSGVLSNQEFTERTGIK